MSRWALAYGFDGSQKAERQCFPADFRLICVVFSGQTAVIVEDLIRWRTRVRVGFDSDNVWRLGWF